MPTIHVLPHPLCPSGLSFECRAGTALAAALLSQGIALEHACEMSCACSTCHVHVRGGRSSLSPAKDAEEDELDNAWGVDADSRLACQVRLAQVDLLVELPLHSRNHAREHG